MDTRIKLIIGGAACLVVATLTIVTMKGLASPPARLAEQDFSARFQPKPPIVAGIGSTRDLKPVPLDNSSATATPPQGEGSGERGHHAPGRTGR